LLHCWVKPIQSVGLAPIVSDSNPQETFVTDRGHSTPGTIRREMLIDVLDDREIQTIGGLIWMWQCDLLRLNAKQTRSLFWMMTMKATTMSTWRKQVVEDSDDEVVGLKVLNT
jgi:hypothetical protein